MTVINLSDAELMSFLGSQERAELLSPLDKVSDAVALLREGRLRGDRLPFNKTSNEVALAGGEISLWAGVNGSGKTELLSYVMQSMLQRGRRVLVASMEMTPEETLITYATQSARCEPSVKYLEGWAEKYKDDFYIYDRQGRVPVESLIGLVYYAKQLGINHMIIDSLTMCGISRDAYDRQAEFVNHLRVAAKFSGIHIHLVCHMRKGEDERRPPNKFDIRGAGEVTDLSDKVFIVWRNKIREHHAKEVEAGYSSGNPDILDQWGVRLVLCKNRQAGHEQSYGLMYDHDSRCYSESKNQQGVRAA